MLQIALVADEHDDDVRVRVVAELLEPSGDVHVRAVLRDVVHEQRADGSAVVARGRRKEFSAWEEGMGAGGNDARSGDGTVTLLAGFSMV